MIRAGDTRHSLGSRLDVIDTAQTTGGRRVRVRVAYAPQRRFPPLHLHPRQTETFAVQAGTLTVRWPGGVGIYGAGETFTVPPGTPHAMRNAGPGPAVVEWTVEPALRTGELFAHLYSARTRPPLADILAFVRHVVLSRRFRPEMVLVRGGALAGSPATPGETS